MWNGIYTGFFPTSITEMCYRIGHTIQNIFFSLWCLFIGLFLFLYALLLCVSFIKIYLK